jgi:membrane protein implicated in regulation of membrane protease activity
VTPLSAWRSTIAIVGVLVFLYGAKTENEIVRWVGVACLAIALVLRFLGRRQPR